MLVCPPTQHVREFYNINKQGWLDEAVDYADRHGFECLIRDKDNPRELTDDLAGAGAVYTFNSSVGWHAIANGIPCISDAKHSVVGRWQQQLPGRGLDLLPSQGRALISYLMKHQWKLQEIAEGKAKDFICRSASI